MAKFNLLFLLSLSLSGVSITFAVDRPNILFVVSDDHGWGDLPSNWDETEVQLPTLEALAATGIRFSNYHTVPLCGPSRACMFTGQFSTENGMWRGPGNYPLGSPAYRGIKRDVKMVSEYLSDAGYKTGAFGKWHMGSLEGEVPNDRGFDEFHGFLAGAHPYWIQPGRSKIMHNRDPDQQAAGHATELFTSWAEEFIRSSTESDAPFFCYLAYNAVHGPLRVDETKPASAPEEWVNKALDRGVSLLRSDYVAILEHMDHNLGGLISLLDELGVAENTLIVFVSDNGGCTMDEGTAGGRFPGNNGPYRGGKATTYQGGLSVPMLMNWRGRLTGGITSQANVMHCDLFSTLLDAAEIPLAKVNGRNPIRGMSLLPHMISGGKEVIPERAMIFELWGNVGLRRGDYKLWSDVGRDYSPDWDALAKKIEQTDLVLYDLGQDVGETQDLRNKHPDVYASLKGELVEHLKAIHSDDLRGGSQSVHQKEETHSMQRVRVNRGASVAKELPFLHRDRNGDGWLSLREFVGSAENQAAATRTKRFRMLDRNADGQLQPEELRSSQ